IDRDPAAPQGGWSGSCGFFVDVQRRADAMRCLRPGPGPPARGGGPRWGPRGARPKAYLHASLHADEIPAMLVLHHLIRLLDEADRAGAIKGDIVVVPMANPIGVAQVINTRHVGRYELAGGGNFNRNWPD